MAHKIVPLLVTMLWGLWCLPAQAFIPFSQDGQPIPTIAPMLERVTPGVVNIAADSKESIRTPLSPFLEDPMLRRFFELPKLPPEIERSQRSLGSGVIVDAKRGYILTNNHVIDQAGKILITLWHDPQDIEAKLIGRDTPTDLALIQIRRDQRTLTALTFGDSSKLRVGDFVVAIGNPFGLGNTVTSGIVSGLNRSGIVNNYLGELIQTDASINPGNSGGALVNLNGELIGINAAIYTANGGNIGIGFATPASIARRVMSDLVRYGKVRRGQLGIMIQDLTPDRAVALGVTNQQGVLVVEVQGSSAAKHAGLRPDDVIVGVNGESVASSEELQNKVAMAIVGEKLRLEIIRHGVRQNIVAEIEEPR